MDGIEITRILDMDTKKEVFYGCDYDEVPEDEIQKMIEVNEGIVAAGPDFKHSVKLTPNLTHRSLKKRKRKSLNDCDDDDDSTPSPQDRSSEILPRRIEKGQKLATSLRAEISSLKLERQRVKEDLEVMKKTLKKVNGELKGKILLLEKYDHGLKKRGRRLGGAKLREELGILDGEPEVKPEKEPVKRGRGRPRKYSLHVENHHEPISPLSDSATKKKKTPLKEKDLNRGSSMRVCLKKIDLSVKAVPKEDVAIVVKNEVDVSEMLANMEEAVRQEEDSSSKNVQCEDVSRKVVKEDVAAGPISPIRRSNRQMRCSEKLAALIEMSPKLDDKSVVVRKILNEGGVLEPKVPEKKVKQKRKVDASSEGSPPVKKLKADDQTGRRDVRASSTSSESNSTSCRSIKQAKQAMMKGVASTRACVECLKGSPAPLKCQKCFTFLHPKCAGDTTAQTDADWICPMCVSGKNPCFVCKLDKGTRQMCLSPGCGKYYHHDCLKLFPQTKFNHGDRKNVGLLMDPDDTSPPPLEILTCSRHTCHTCASDNPIAAKFVHQDKLLNCVKCPTSYHCTPGACLTAGTEILSTCDIICGKHLDTQSSKTVNITWCFVCNKGGSLTYCALCPSAIHPECLKIKPPEGKYFCEECESGRFPLHGEIVWVKLGSYRWWPSKVLYPDEVPKKLEQARHKRCEFAIMFLGTNDFQWANRGRTFLYNEEDTQKNFRIQKRLDRNFQLAMEEASAALKHRKEVIDAHRLSKKDKPDAFINIRSNKYDNKISKKTTDEENNICSCSIEDEDPCGPNSNCLNRGLLLECSPDLCPAGNRCLNQRFAKREYPNLDVFKTTDRGWGVRCKEDLQQGQFVIEYVGQVIDDAELERRLKVKRESKNSNYYLMRLDANRVLDAEPCGNKARFINHSCRPNCETQKWTVNGATQIGIFAAKFIRRGEELTFNYDWTMPGMRSACYCGADGCTGIIGEIPKKTVKPEKKKKKKPKMTETQCSLCQKSGENFVVCSSEKCPRVVHMACANLSTKSNDWVCSHHRCVKCGSKTKRNCQECKEAYCGTHTNNNIFSNEKGQLFCSKHVAGKPFSNNSRKSTYLSRAEATEEANSSISSSSSQEIQCSLV